MLLVRDSSAKIPKLRAFAQEPHSSNPTLALDLDASAFLRSYDQIRILVPYFHPARIGYGFNPNVISLHFPLQGSPILAGRLPADRCPQDDRTRLPSRAYEKCGLLRPWQPQGCGKRVKIMDNSTDRFPRSFEQRKARKHAKRLMRSAAKERKDRKEMSLGHTGRVFT